MKSLFQWNKLTGTSCTDTRSSVLHPLGCGSELAKVMSNVIGRDFNGNVYDTVVHANFKPNEFGEDHHVPVVGSHHDFLSVFLCFSGFF